MNVQPTPEQDAASLRFRFAAPERGGLLAGFRTSQLAVVGTCALVSVGVLRAQPNLVGVAVAVGIVAGGLACVSVPLGGRTLEEWAPDVVRHLLACAIGTRRLVVRPYATGTTVVAHLGARGAREAARTAAPNEVAAAHNGWPERATRADRKQGAAPWGNAEVPHAGSRRPGRTLPQRMPFVLRRERGWFGLDLVAAGGAPGVGAIHDRQEQRCTLVARLEADGVGLLASAEQERVALGWARALAGLADEQGSVARVQWVHRSVPVPRHAGAPWRHETYLAVSTPRRAPRVLGGLPRGRRARAHLEPGARWGAGSEDRAIARGEDSCCARTLRALKSLRRRLGPIGVVLGPPLGESALARVLRASYAPLSLGVGVGGPDDQRQPGGIGADQPWPLSLEAWWSMLRVEGSWHRVFWVHAWPLVDVRSEFLVPLLAWGGSWRTLSVVMEPVAPSLAAKRVAAKRTERVADAELRRRGGFLATARDRRADEALRAREAELADGHAEFRFSGYLDAAAHDPDGLEAASSLVLEAAARAGLGVVPCYGDQRGAFFATLPLGRGLQ